MATENVTHSVLIIASEEIGATAEKALAIAGAFRAKSVTGARPALAAIGGLVPHFLVIEASRLPLPAIQAVKNMSELAASRPVPVYMVCGPLDEILEKQRASLGISQVLNSPFDANALVEQLKAAVEKASQARKEALAKQDAARKQSDTRKAKQMQIQERLRTASSKYASMSEAAARERLNAPPPPPPEVQDFASDDAAPPAPADPNKPPDEPTWDGDRKSRS